jgi:transposase-like protein
MKDTIRYSEAFKLQVVRELEEGRHANCHSAGTAYGIGGAETVRRWVCEYGKNHLIGKVIHVSTTTERSELRKAKDRIRELERALSDAHLDIRLEQSYVKLACRAGGIDDVAEFKKKHAGMLSMTRQAVPGA